MTGDASIINAKFFWYLLLINLLVDIHTHYHKRCIASITSGKC